MTCHRQRVAPGLQTRDDCCACCLRLPVGTVLNRCRRAIRRPVWRAVRGGLRTHRPWHYFVPVCSHASSATLFTVALLSTATEADAMNESDTFSSYTAVELINDDTPLPDLNSLLGILKRMRGCEGADGLPWPENDVSPGRRVSLARTERALVGLLTVLEVLHSADRCRVAAEPERHLDEGTVDGLFLACRGLAEWACREVRPE